MGEQAAQPPDLPPEGVQRGNVRWGGRCQFQTTLSSSVVAGKGAALWAQGFHQEWTAAWEGSRVSSEERALYPQLVASPQVPGTSLFA